MAVRGMGLKVDDSGDITKEELIEELKKKDRELLNY